MITISEYGCLLHHYYGLVLAYPAILLPSQCRQTMEHSVYLLVFVC